MVCAGSEPVGKATFHAGRWSGSRTVFCVVVPSTMTPVCLVTVLWDLTLPCRRELVFIRTLACDHALCASALVPMEVCVVLATSETEDQPPVLPCTFDESPRVSVLP